MSKSQINATVILALTSAIAIAGEVLKPGTPGKPTLIEVSQEEAKDLLHRGKAVLHDHDPESGNAVFSSGANGTGAGEENAYAVHGVKGTFGTAEEAAAAAEAAEREAAALAEKEAADKAAKQAAAAEAAAKPGKRK